MIMTIVCGCDSDLSGNLLGTFHHWYQKWHRLALQTRAPRWEVMAEETFFFTFSSFSLASGGRWYPTVYFTCYYTMALDVFKKGNPDFFDDNIKKNISKEINWLIPQLVGLDPYNILEKIATSGYFGSSSWLRNIYRDIILVNPLLKEFERTQSFSDFFWGFFGKSEILFWRSDWMVYGLHPGFSSKWEN